MSTINRQDTGGRLARFDALYEDPATATPPRITVGFGDRSLDVRDLDGLLIAQWAYADLRATGPMRPGQALVLTCTASPNARLTLLDADSLPLLRLHAPQAVRERMNGDTLLTGCTLGSLAGCGGGCLFLVALPFVVVAILMGWLALPSWLGGPASSGVLFDRFSHWMTPAVEVSLPPVCDDTHGQAELDRLARRLAPAGGLETVPAVTVLDTPQPVLFHLGPEQIYLTRGLIDRLSGPDEVSALVAHALGHIAQGDAVTLTTTQDDLPEGTVWRIDANRCTDEDDALEADAWALRALRRAGWRADGLRSHLDHLPRGMAGAWKTQMCLHPVTDERLRALRLSTPDGGSPALTEAQWQAVRGMCG